MLSSKRSHSVGRTRLTLTKSPLPRRSESSFAEEHPDFSDILRRRVNQYYRKIFKDLVSGFQNLVLSPAQEQEILKFQAAFLKKLETNDTPSFFQKGLGSLSRLFSKLIQKLRVVVKHSSGLSSSKEKDLLGLVDRAAEEAAAIQIIDFLPSLSQNFTALNLLKGIRCLSGTVEAANLKDSGLCFSRWRKRAARLARQPDQFERAAHKLKKFFTKSAVRSQEKRFTRWLVRRYQQDSHFKQIFQQVRPELLRCIVSHLGTTGGVYGAVTDFYLNCYPDNLHHCELLLLEETGQKLKGFLANKSYTLTLSSELDINKVVREGRVLRYPDDTEYSQLAREDRPLRGDLKQGSLIVYPLYSTHKEILGAVRVYGAQMSQKELYVLECVSLIVGEYLGEMERHQTQATLTMKRIEELEGNMKGHSKTTETLRYFFEVLCCLHTASSSGNFKHELDFLRDLVSHVTARIFPSISSYSLFVREEHKLRRLIHQSVKEQSQVNSEEEAMLLEVAGDELEIDEEILLSSRQVHKNVLYIPLIDPSTQTNFGTLLLKSATGSVQNESNALEYQEYMRTICAILGRWKAVQNNQSELIHNMSQLEEQNDSLSQDMTMHALLSDLRIQLSSPDLDTFEKLQKIIQSAVLATRQPGLLSSQLGLVRDDMLILSAAQSRRYEESLSRNRGRNTSLTCGTPDSSFHSFSTLTKVSIDFTPKRALQSPLLQVSLPLHDIPGLPDALTQNQIIILPLANLALKPHVGGVLGNIFQNGLSGNLLHQQRLALAFVPVLSQKSQDSEGLLSFAREQEVIGVIVVCLRCRLGRENIGREIEPRAFKMISQVVAQHFGATRMSHNIASNMESTLAVQEQRAAESSLLKRALMRINQYLSLQPLRCLTLRDLMLSVAALLKDVMNCAHSHLWLFNTQDLLGIRYEKATNLPSVCHLPSSIALFCVRNLLAQQNSTYIFNGSACALQGENTGSFSPQPSFAQLYDPEIDLFKEHKTKSALSCVLFQDPSLDLCILLQMYNKVNSPFCARDAELVNLLGESLAPLFHNHLSSKLTHCPLDKLIGSSAVFSALQSSIFCRLGSTLRALGGQHKQTKLRALKRMARVVEKHHFTRFAKPQKRSEREQFLGGLCQKQQARQLRRFFLKFQVKTCEHFWSQNQSRLSDSVLTSNQEYSIHALKHFLSRRERTNKSSFFKRWLKKYQKESRAVQYFVRTFQGFLKFHKDRFLGRSFKKLKGGKASSSTLQKLFKQWKRRALQAYFKTLKMNSFEVSFEKSKESSSSSSTSFIKVISSLLRKEQSVSKRTFLRRWAGISNKHFKARAKQILDDNSELAHQTKSVSFYNSLFQIGATLQKEVAESINQNKNISVKSLTSSLPFRAFFTSLKEFVVNLVHADLLVILLSYPSSPESSVQKALAIVFRTSHTFTSSPLGKPQGSIQEQLDDPLAHFASNCSEISQHFHHPRSSISSLGDLVRNMNQGPIASGRQSPISNFLAFNSESADICLTLEDDALFKAVSHSPTPINPLLDSSFLHSLRRRKILTTVGTGIAAAIPDISGSSPIGAIELYRLSGLSQPLKEQEASLISQTASQISSSAALLQNLVKTCNALSRRNREEETLLELNSRFDCPSTGTLSTTVRRCSEHIRQLFKASSTLLILLPLNSSVGYFYDFTENNLYHFDYTGSFLQEVLQNGLSFRRFQNLSVNGTQCSEIVYLPIPRSSSHYFGIIEICNPSYSFKRLEQEVSSRMASVLSKYEEKLTQLSQVVESNEHKKRINELKWKFQMWRESAETFKIEGSICERESDALRLTFAAEQKQSEIEKMRQRHEAQIKRCSIVETESAQIRGEMRRFSRDKRMKARVGGLALLKKTMQHFKQKRLTLSDGFSLWKTKVLCTRIAQAAFNKVMQLNHRHASVRLDVAVRLLSRCVKQIHHSSFKKFLRSIRSVDARSKKVERSPSPLHGVNIQEPNYHRNLISVNASLPAFKKNVQLLAPEPGEALRAFHYLAKN